MNQSIRIVIGALGGEGGGVLAKWIADMAEEQGYLSQMTSVPGVAQRTGATIYYIEIFPRAEAEAAGRQPVMSMFPSPGDVDLVLCSEIAEAGRLLQRGFVTPERTILITSTHRSYAIGEKIAMGSGIIDKEAIASVARNNAKKYIAFDMLEIARRYDSVINAALLGAVAGSGSLPFAREVFENTIRRGKIAVESNLQTFTESFNRAQQLISGGVGYIEPVAAVEAQPFVLPKPTTEAGQKLLQRMAAYPEAVQEKIYLGVKKLVDYQDYRYAEFFLNRVEEILNLDKAHRDFLLTQETARFLALWMAFEDLARVAQIKISKARFERFRQEVRAEDGQLVSMVEFLHPRVEEFCGAMPAKLGRFLLHSKLARKFLGLFAGARNIRTNSLHGYLAFYLIAKLRYLRRASLMYETEQQHIEHWLQAVKKAAAQDYDLAVALAKAGRLIKGYGDTRERGTRNLARILAVFNRSERIAATDLDRLREAALADEEGRAFTQAEQELLLRSQ